jgi:hypothetical protein
MASVKKVGKKMPQTGQKEKYKMREYANTGNLLKKRAKSEDQRRVLKGK